MSVSLVEDRRVGYPETRITEAPAGGAGNRTQILWENCEQHSSPQFTSRSSFALS